MTPTLFIDGDCAFCHRSVRFIVRHERDTILRFASSRSELGRTLLAVNGVEIPRGQPTPGTMVLIDDAGVHQRTDAAVRLAARLRRPWNWLTVLRVVPRAIRDAVYGQIAAHRHRLIRGGEELCEVPEPDLRRRFIDLDPGAGSTESLHSEGTGGRIADRPRSRTAAIGDSES